MVLIHLCTQLLPGQKVEQSCSLYHIPCFLSINTNCYFPWKRHTQMQVPAITERCSSACSTSSCRRSYGARLWWRHRSRLAEATTGGDEPSLHRPYSRLRSSPETCPAVPQRRLHAAVPCRTCRRHSETSHSSFLPRWQLYRGVLQDTLHWKHKNKSTVSWWISVSPVKHLGFSWNSP